MISSISGKALERGAGFVVVAVGGFGVRVELVDKHRSPRVNVGDECFFHTAFIVREDQMTLYGFETPEELVAFNLLLTVTGVGPRSALGVLSELEPDAIALAVQNEDEKVFRAVSGIGPKTAKLILVSLSGKMHVVARPETETPGSENGVSLKNTVLAGLITLGWSENVAQSALAAAELEASANGETVGAEELLKLSLRKLQTPDFARRNK